MKLEEFEKIVKNYREGSDMVSELYSIGFDLFEGKYKLSDAIYSLFISSLESHYTSGGIDWVTWFIFENEWGKKEWSKVPSYNEDSGIVKDVSNDNIYGATDENGSPICYDIPSLWRYLENGYRNINCDNPNVLIH